MKYWQIILIDACVMFAAASAAVGLFAPKTPPDPAKELAEKLETEVRGLQTKLDIIKTAVLEQEKHVLPTKMEKGASNGDETLSKLNRKLDMIIGKLAVFENRSPPVQPPQTFGHSPGSSSMASQMPASPLTGKGSAGWIDRLPDDKKRQVKIILEEHLVQMREKLPPPDPNGRIPDREAIARIVEEDEAQLKQELKSILTEEQYQQFLDSRPNPAMLRQPLPPVRENQ